MSSLPSSQSYLKEIHQLLYNFLWDGRGDKIKRSVMLNEYKDGGLRVCPSKNQAGGDKAQITNFAQTWHKCWVWCETQML